MAVISTSSLAGVGGEIMHASMVDFAYLEVLIQNQSGIIASDESTSIAPPLKLPMYLGLGPCEFGPFGNISGPNLNPPSLGHFLPFYMACMDSGRVCNEIFSPLHEAMLGPYAGWMAL